jgi:hypothetical protein
VNFRSEMAAYRNTEFLATPSTPGLNAPPTVSQASVPGVARGTHNVL